MITHPEASRERLLAFAREIPGAYVGIKIAALLLILEGQRPGWVFRGLRSDASELKCLDAQGKRTGVESLKP